MYCLFPDSDLMCIFDVESANDFHRSHQVVSSYFLMFAVGLD